MSAHSPPYLMDYRVARALMAEGNIGPDTLVSLLDSGNAFFFDGDKADFEKCSVCSVFLTTHKQCFKKPVAGDLAVQGAIAKKLISKGQLAPARRTIAGPTLRMAGIAARESLTCVVQPHAVLFDNMAAYKAAHIPVVSLSDFIDHLAS